MELGGENSIRLVLGGFFADLTAAHYSWVAWADERNPDTTTAQTWAESILARIRTLFTDGLILTLPVRSQVPRSSFSRRRVTIQWATVLCKRLASAIGKMTHMLGSFFGRLWAV